MIFIILMSFQDASALVKPPWFCSRYRRHAMVIAAAIPTHTTVIWHNSWLAPATITMLHSLFLFRYYWYICWLIIFLTAATYKLLQQYRWKVIALWTYHHCRISAIHTHVPPTTLSHFAGLSMQQSILHHLTQPHSRLPLMSPHYSASKWFDICMEALFHNVFHWLLFHDSWFEEFRSMPIHSTIASPLLSLIMMHIISEAPALLFHCRRCCYHDAQYVEATLVSHEKDTAW